MAHEARNPSEKAVEQLVNDLRGRPFAEAMAAISSACVIAARDHGLDKRCFLGGMADMWEELKNVPTTTVSHVAAGKVTH